MYKRFSIPYSVGAVFSYCNPGAMSLVLIAISAFFNSYIIKKMQKEELIHLINISKNYLLHFPLKQSSQ